MGRLMEYWERKSTDGVRELDRLTLDRTWPSNSQFDELLWKEREKWCVWGFVAGFLTASVMCLILMEAFRLV